MGAPHEAPAETADSLGALLLSLLPTLRLHSVSLLDARANVQWLSEGALGPDEQGAAATAIATLSEATTRAHCDAPMAPGRSALFLAVRTPRAKLAGVVMLLMDTKTLSSGNLAARILNTRMRSALHKVALFLAPPPPASATSTVSGIQQLADGTGPIDMAITPITDPGETASESVVDDLLDWRPAVAEEPPTPIVPETPATREPVSGKDVLGLLDANAQSPDVPLLRLRELIRLRPGGRSRYYQIVPLVAAQRGDALTTLSQFLRWLHQNPRVLRGDPLNFTIGVSAQFLADPELPGALQRVMADAALPPGTMGFELREAACVSHKPLAERFLSQCEQMRCFAVIDDFTFNTAMLDLLRASAVRMLKVEARLAAAAMRDKLSQARVIAIAQAAKVLGTHCAAKYVESQSDRRWLAGAGFDFTQSSVDEPVERLKRS